METDLPVFFEHQQDPEANQMAAFPARDWNSFSSHWARILADTAIAKKTILFEGNVAGNIVIFEQSGLPQVGYWIGKDYWGKGVATKALSDFLGHVKVRPLYAHVAQHNAASIRVLEKSGFAVSGRDRSFANTGGEEIEEVILKLV